MEQNEKQTDLSWLEEEAAAVQQPIGERLPSTKFVENEIQEITIDFSKPFVKWPGTSKAGVPVVKAMIPNMHNGVREIWWLNVKNPVYRLIIEAGRHGQTVFRILQTGTQDQTKYILVK